MECKWPGNFTVAKQTLKIFENPGPNVELITIDTRCVDNSFVYKNHMVTYTALDGGNPSSAIFVGHKTALTWGEFLSMIEDSDCTFLQGELSIFILGDTMRIAYKDPDGYSMRCRFRINCKSMM